MNKYLKILGAVLVFLVILLVIFKKAGWIGGEDEIEVSIDTVARRTIIETVSANGRIQPETEVKISSDVSGEVVELNVREGSRVKKGDILLLIKPDVYLSAVEKMEATLNSARAALANDSARLTQSKTRFLEADLSWKRSKKLWESKTVSDADYENATTQFEVAKSEVDAARQAVKASSFNVKSVEAGLREATENYAKTTIKAPVDGTVYQLAVEKGDRVVGTSLMAGTELLRIADLNEMEVSVEVNENDIVKVSFYDTVDIEVDAYLGKKFRGIVTEVANAAKTAGTDADQVTNFDVKIRILKESYATLVKDSGSSPFRPGMSATVDIRTGKVLNVLAVPIQSVTTRDASVFDSTGSGKEKREESGGIKRKRDPDSHREKKDKKIDKPEECVFICVDGKAKLVKVKTGIQDNEFIEIVSGLEEKTEVISAPYSAISKLLKDGSPVEKVDKEKLWGKERKEE
ncbi:MAG: efflux RND transporter periplasmic adaptor subunit [Bacteroidetes bacterium]|nr:efflux RND transporter periplasmic adaptor subunit [Bacteroidota bacterium]